MSDSICKFMPAKGYSSDIRTVHFVYETEFKRLQQPFFSPTYRIVLVTKGTAMLKTHSGTFDLKPGSIFFTLPVDLHEIDAGDDFEYYYISFVGSGVAALLEELGITPSSPVYFDEYGLTDFWKASIQRINDKNINVLTESVLLYTLSFINNASDKDRKSTEKQFDFIIDYINNHYRERDLSLKKLAEIFSYTEK